MTKDDILQLDRRRVPRGKPTGGLNSIFHVWEHVYHTPAEIKSPQSLTFPTVPNKIIFYVAFQIIGKYLLFINCLISNSYTISQDCDDF